MSKHTFIPSNYPKSLIILVIAGLSGLASGGVAFVGVWLRIPHLEVIGRFGFFACWIVMAIMFVVFLPKAWGGEYRGLAPRPWKEQVW